MKILNLYAGIGGNRALWGNNHEITAVEINPEIAKIYNHFFPKDKVIVEDAHNFLLENYKKYDFIWSSPPCQSHSRARAAGLFGDNCPYEAVYPDMALYQEIILLEHFSKCPYVIENVKGYYKPLIKPSQILERHYFWSNFLISKENFESKRKHDNIEYSSEIYGFSLKDFKIPNKRQILRNLINPELGLHLLKHVIKK